MALLFNNLVINFKSKKYMPFLFNLVSGRRRLLSSDDFQLVCSILQGNKVSKEEQTLINKLRAEKQFFTDEERSDIEQKIIASGIFSAPSNSQQGNSLGISIEITQNCNMNCSYCFAKSRTNTTTYMTKDHIDAIDKFYRTYADNSDERLRSPSIRITGGEPLINHEIVDLINYVVSKWPEAKIALFTNGVNLLRFYNSLPIKSLDEVHISLDGVKDIHLDRRYNGSTVDDTIFNNIISGIKRLLHDNVKVVLKTTIDKTTYKSIPDLISLLKEEGILDSPHFKQSIGFVFDYTNPLEIDCAFNNKQDISEIQEYFSNLEGINSPQYLSTSILLRTIVRPMNEPWIPKHQRCKTDFLSNYYFSSSGDIYFCDWSDDGKGTVGTYYPDISIDNTITTKLANRSVFANDKCIKCPYKFVCLGGCPLSAIGQNAEMACGIYADEEILDNLEFNYHWIPAQ